MDDTARICEIENMIRDMNRSWTAGWHEDLFRQYIHPDAVAVVPTTPGRLEGRDAYVAGWRGFAQAVIIHEWRETDQWREKCRGHVLLLDHVCSRHE